MEKGLEIDTAKRQKIINIAVKAFLRIIRQDPLFRNGKSLTEKFLPALACLLFLDEFGANQPGCTLKIGKAGIMSTKISGYGGLGLIDLLEECKWEHFVGGYSARDDFVGLYLGQHCLSKEPFYASEIPEDLYAIVVMDKSDKTFSVVGFGPWDMIQDISSRNTSIRICGETLAKKRSAKQPMFYTISIAKIG